MKKTTRVKQKNLNSKNYAEYINNIFDKNNIKVKSKDFKNSINDILRNNKKIFYEDINKKINDALDGIGDILFKIDNNSYALVRSDAHKVLENLTDLVQYIENVYDDKFPSYLNSIYKELKLKYKKFEYYVFDNDYKHSLDEIDKIKINYEKNNNILNNKIEELTNLIDIQKQESDKLTNKFEGLGATLINIVLTISIISSAVAAIEKIENPIHIPMFIMVITWLLITCILFCQFIFKNKNYLSKGMIVFYICFSILVFITFIISFFVKI